MEVHILSVSYDRGLLKRRENLFRSQGWQVTSAIRLEEALHLCRTQVFDLVIISRFIPKSKKERFIKALRSVSTTPVLALIGPGDDTVSGADHSLVARDKAVTLVDTVKKILLKLPAA